MLSSRELNNLDLYKPTLIQYCSIVQCLLLSTVIRPAPYLVLFSNREYKLHDILILACLNKGAVQKLHNAGRGGGVSLCYDVLQGESGSKPAVV